MDRSRYKQPETKIEGQQTKATFEADPYNVSKVLTQRAQISSGFMANQPTMRANNFNNFRRTTIEANPSSIVEDDPLSYKARTDAKPVIEAASIDKVKISTAVLARQLPIDMSLSDANEESTHSNYRLKLNRLSKVGVKGFATFVLVILTMGGLIFAQSYVKLHQVFRGGSASAAALQTSVNPNLLKGEGSGRVNLLLLGRAGGSGPNADVTNTIMIASIDPVNDEATLVSLPSSLWINAPTAGLMKLSDVWETGEFQSEGSKTPGSTSTKNIEAGFKLADQTVSQVTGVNVNYNAIVNYQAIADAVNTVGGVNVNVSSALVDPTVAWQNSNNPTIAQAGEQKLNAAQALLYMRSEETTSDFSRAGRQRDVLVALMSKMESSKSLSNPIKIASLINAFGSNMTTDLSMGNADRLYNILKKIPDSKVNSIDLYGQNGTNQYVATGNANGQAVVIPSAGLFSYSAIQQFLRSQLKDPYIMKEAAKVLVLNGTTTPGLATTESKYLSSYGYNVTGMGNTSNASYSKSVVYNLNSHDTYTNHYLDSRFNAESVHKLPKTIDSNGADFVIIIGSNEATTIQNQAN